MPAPDYKALFDSAPDPCLVLDRDLIIVAANEARLRVTATKAEDIVGRHVFDVFPDNPADVTATGVRNLAESLRRVLQNRSADTMPLQRYDIRTSGETEKFEERYWSAVNTPVLGPDGEVEYIIHRVQDVTEYVLLKRGDKNDKSQEELQGRVEALESEIYLKAREVAAANKELEDAVKAANATRKMFDSFMAHLPAAAWMKDSEGRYVFANVETERLFKVSIADLVGKRSEDVFTPEIAQQFFAIDRRILKEGGSLPPVQVVHQAGGRERYLLVTKFVIRDASGAPEFIAGVAIDTTETKRMEVEIQRLASISMENPNPVMEVSFNGKVTFCNPAAIEVLQNCCYNPDCNPFIPDDFPDIVKVCDQSTRQWMREVEIAGSVFEEVIIVAPQSKSVRCYTMDVTRRKRAEREREQLLLQLQAVLENINEGVVITALDGQVLAMNKEALELHDFEDMEEVRRHVSEFQDIFEIATLKGVRLHLDEWPVMRALRGERFFDYEVRVYNKLSGRQWVGSYSGTPVRNSEEETILAVLSVRDITRRKEMEEQIVNLNADLAGRVAELEQTNQELEAFNRMVSHDLRQPLNTIATSCQAVQMLCDVGEECKSYIDIAYKKVLVMNDLIESLLRFSRSTHRELRREAVDLSDLARSVYGDIRLAEPQRSVTFSVTDHLIVDADLNLLRSVLENLIGNAWKYTSLNENAVIEVGSTEIGGEETFFVRDNGTGFDAAEGRSLFTPFRRLPGSEQFSGFGIGLATVDRIIRRHGGRVCAEGEPGKGATFYFTLPKD